MNTIQSAVENFFGTKRICYAAPGTDNHSANFYGDTHICKLNRADVIGCIETARDGWVYGDDDDGGGVREQMAINAVLNDLQFEKPE